MCIIVCGTGLLTFWIIPETANSSTLILCRLSYCLSGISYNIAGNRWRRQRVAYDSVHILRKERPYRVLLEQTLFSQSARFERKHNNIIHIYYTRILLPQRVETPNGIISESGLLCSVFGLKINTLHTLNTPIYVIILIRMPYAYRIHHSNIIYYIY